MNKHIELVKKWLADKDSVSKEELRENADAAYYAAYDAAYYAATHAAAAAAAAKAAYYAATHAAYGTAYYAYAAAAAYASDDAEYWVNKYEELAK